MGQAGMMVLKKTQIGDVVFTAGGSAGHADIDASDIKAIREKLGISQGVLARLLNCSVFKVRQWEKGSVLTVKGADALLIRLALNVGLERYAGLVLGEI
jgi:DNA-binding transcriptional regulator YiaG